MVVGSPRVGKSTFDKELKQWIFVSPQRERPQVYQLLEKHGERKKIVIFKTGEETDDDLNTMERR